MSKHPLEKYDRPAPRYTSFPPATQFSHEITQDTYKGLLGSLPEDSAISLYVHIPFCHQLCHYCGCNTKVINTYEPVRSYLKFLHREIEMAGRAAKVKPPVNRLHFGGGSPNYLKEEDLKGIIDALGEHFGFNAGTDIDMECDPRFLNAEMLKPYADMGVTRISLGVQDFDRDVQDAINRVQPYELVRDRVADIRAAGIRKINFDLMTGLPRQSLETVSRTVDQAVSLDPDRLAVFPYAHVPWMKKHQKLMEKYEMPDTALRFDQGQLVHEKLLAAGYEAIGIDHYAKPDDPLMKALKERTMRRNFQGYTDDSSHTIVSFGISSISSYEGAYVQNTPDAPTYRAAIEKGAFPIMRGCVLTNDDQRRRALIEELMCYFDVNLNDYDDVAFTDPKTRPALAVLEQDGLISLQDNRLTITPEGKTFVRIVASAFDPYFAVREGQHAKAI